MAYKDWHWAKIEKKKYVDLFGSLLETLSNCLSHPSELNRNSIDD